MVGIKLDVHLRLLKVIWHCLLGGRKCLQKSMEWQWYVLTSVPLVWLSAELRWHFWHLFIKTQHLFLVLVHPDFPGCTALRRHAVLSAETVTFN